MSTGNDSAELLLRAQKLFQNSGVPKIQEHVQEWAHNLTRSKMGTSVNVLNLLAPSYGPLNKPAFVYVDRSLEYLVSEAISELEKAHAENKPITWSVVNAAFRQAPCMQLDELGSKSEFKQWAIERKKRGSKSSVDESIVNELTGWLNELIQDTEILGLDSTKLLPTELSMIVAKCGVLRDCMNNSVSSMSKDFLEIGILRFPDIDNPYIQVYRISLSAWATCDRETRVFGPDKIVNRNGVTGHYQTCIFRPRERFITLISEAAYRLAAADREVEKIGKN